jgi:hypothetical protein
MAQFAHLLQNGRALQSDTDMQSMHGILLRHDGAPSVIGDAAVESASADDMSRCIPSSTASPITGGATPVESAQTVVAACPELHCSCGRALYDAMCHSCMHRTCLRCFVRMGSCCKQCEALDGESSDDAMDDALYAAPSRQDDVVSRLARRYVPVQTACGAGAMPFHTHVVHWRSCLQCSVARAVDLQETLLAMRGAALRGKTGDI